MTLTNHSGKIFCAFLGTENPHPPVDVLVHPGQSVVIEAVVWDTIVRTLKEQGESIETYNLEVI